jgi:hypothetical protein
MVALGGGTWWVLVAPGLGVRVATSAHVYSAQTFLPLALLNPV